MWDHARATAVAGGAFSLALTAGLVVATTSTAGAHDDPGHLAATPPMGWNSWNAFHKDIDEQLIRDTADKLVESGMRDAGYQFLVVDGGWRAATRDAPARCRPIPSGSPAE